MSENSEQVEQLAALVHQAYLDTCARLGWPVKAENQVAYEDLGEDSKELDRASVHAVLQATQIQQLQAEIDELIREGNQRAREVREERSQHLMKIVAAERERDWLKGQLGLPWNERMLQAEAIIAALTEKAKLADWLFAELRPGAYRPALIAEFATRYGLIGNPAIAQAPAVSE